MSSDHPSATASPPAAALLVVMEEISEIHYCAGWMHDLEFNLWRIAQGGDPEYGMLPISPGMVATLKWLAEQAGGWWVWDASKPVEEHAEVFVSTAEWLKRYEDWAAQR